MNHTTNPQDADETARALLWRHGLPEDVIDGALCLHAQELAAVQRRDAAVWGVDTAAGKHILGAADLIDQTRTTPAVSPSAVVSADRATLESVCICGHPERQHFEDVCITEITGCDCGDFLPVEEAAEEVVRLRRIVRQTAEEQPAETHSCRNCEGVDPNTCLTNPDPAP